jgi:hypothetical protein
MFFRIPDPTFFHPGSQIQIFSIPDPDTGFRSKNLSILTLKNDFQALGNMVVHSVTGSGSWLFTHPRSRIPEPRSRGQKGTRSRIRIRNTDHMLSFANRPNWMPHLCLRELKNCLIVSCSRMSGTKYEELTFREQTYWAWDGIIWWRCPWTPTAGWIWKS